MHGKNYKTRHNAIQYFYLNTANRLVHVYEIVLKFMLAAAAIVF